MEMLMHLLATLNVGCGSLADISAPPANVRFPKVGIAQHRVHVRFVPILLRKSAMTRALRLVRMS
jgi:hypothetical protein